MNKTLNGLIYTFGWCLCVFCGAEGIVSLPIAFTLVSISLQLFYTYKKNTQLFYQDSLIVFSIIPVGFLMENTFLREGILKYATENELSPFFPPAWILCLYPLFALTLNHSLEFINKSLLFAFFLGLCASFSYLGGVRMGAVTFSNEHPYPLFALALSWSVFLSFMVWMNRKFKKIAESFI